jgi:hypothetical protein
MAAILWGEVKGVHFWWRNCAGASVMTRKLLCTVAGGLVVWGSAFPVAQAQVERAGAPQQAIEECQSSASRAGTKCVTKPIRVGAKCKPKQAGFYAVTKFEG